MPNNMNYGATAQSAAVHPGIHLFHLLPTGSSNTGHPPLLRKPALQRRVLQSPTPDDIAVRGQVFFLVESGMQLAYHCRL